MEALGLYEGAQAVNRIGDSNPGQVRAAMIGAAVGLAMAVLVLLLAWLEQIGKLSIDGFINWSAALPMVMVAPLHVTEDVMAAFFVGYWIAMGGLVGWVLSWKRFRLAAAVLVVGGLAITHQVARVLLEEEVRGAMEAVLRALSKYTSRI